MRGVFRARHDEIGVHACQNAKRLGYAGGRCHGKLELTEDRFRFVLWVAAIADNENEGSESRLVGGSSPPTHGLTSIGLYSLL